MKPPKCRTCNHFDATTDEWDTPQGFGKCRLIEMSCEMSEWDEEYSKETLKPEFNGYLAGVMDGSSYRAVLEPHPDFYCLISNCRTPALHPSVQFRRFMASQTTSRQNS